STRRRHTRSKREWSSDVCATDLSSDDDERYREKEVSEKAKKKDTILFFLSYLKEVGVLSEEKEKEIKTEIDYIVNEATEYAENAAYPEAESALKYVYEE